MLKTCVHVSVCTSSQITEFPSDTSHETKHDINDTSHETKHDIIFLTQPIYTTFNDHLHTGIQQIKSENSFLGKFF